MSAGTAAEQILKELTEDGGPVVEILARMSDGPLAQGGIDEKTALLIRFGALVALDASPVSYLVNLALADEAGITPERLQGALAAVAPVVGTARVVSAAANVRRAMQLARS
jgi:alkylhydroperoxidase/carboxymuconolactone decarboxylase family protein YurZ